MEERIKYLTDHKKSNFWTWFKLGIISTFILTFVAILGVNAETENSENELGLLGCETLLAENQIDYIEKGIQVWNQSLSIDEDLLNAVYELSLSIKIDNNCIKILPKSEHESLLETLDKKSVDKVKIVNGQIKAINRSGFLEPVMKMKPKTEVDIVETSPVEELIRECDGSMYDIYEEIDLADGEVGQKDILFMKKLSEKVGVSFPEIKTWEVSYAEIFTEKAFQKGNCEFKIKKEASLKTENTKYLCDDGSEVVDLLLCPLER